jgi:methionyl-tRNA synthetase
MEPTPKPENLPADDFFKFDIRVGSILSIEAVPKSKKLVKLEVSFGPVVGNRVILAGIASAVPDRVMVGQKVVAVLNLAPRPMMGIESHGMLLATHDEEGKLWLVSPGGPISDGGDVG